MWKGTVIGADTEYIGEQIEKGFALIRDQLSAQDISTGIGSLRNTISTSVGEIQYELSQLKLALNSVNERMVDISGHLKPPPKILLESVPAPAVEEAT